MKASKMKKFCSALMALLTLLTATLMSVNADDAPQTMETAARIDLNRKYSDNISNREDCDWYAFTLSSPGIVSISFEHQNIFKPEECWTAILYNAQTDEICSYSFNGTDEITSTYDVGLPTGTFYLVIRGGDWYSSNIFGSGYSHRFDDCTYSFSVNFTPNEYAEKELNDTMASATRINTDTEITGSINDSNDQDWYSFTLRSPGTVTVTFKRENVLNSNEVWTAALFNEKTAEIWYYGFNGTDTQDNTCTVGLPSGTFYLRIRGGDWYSSNIFGSGYSHRFDDCPYTFSVNFTPNEHAEKELNDTMASATQINTNTKITGSIKDKSDWDWYKFELSTADNISLVFSHEDIKSRDEYWVIQIYNEATDQLASFSASGSAIRSIYTAYLPSGTFYLKIRGGKWYNSGGYSERFDDCTYTISAQTSSYIDPDCPSGDVNGDGSVDAKDIMAIMRHMLNKTPEGFDVGAADFNGDGSVDAKDIMAIMRAMLNNK